MQVTPTWISKDDAIVIQSILMNAILEMLYLSNFANTSWVVDQGNVSNGGRSTSTQFVDVSTSHKSGRTRKLVSYTNFLTSKHGVWDGFVAITTQSYLVNCNGRTLHF